MAGTGIEVGALYATLKLERGAFDENVRHSGVSFGGLAKVAVASGAIIAGAFAGASVEGTKFADDYGRASARVAAITGESITAASKLVSLFQRYGMDGGSAIKTIGMLEKNIGTYTATTKKAAAFEDQFHFSLRNANGTVKDAATLISQAADYFNNKHIPASQKATLESKLFGRSWQSLVPILQLGSKGIADAQQAASDLGLVLTKQNAGELADYRKQTIENEEAMGGLRLQIGLLAMPVFTALGKLFAGVLVPGLRAVTTAVGAWVAANQPLIGAIGNLARAIVGALVTGLRTVAELAARAFAAIGGALTSLAPAVAGAAGALGPLATAIGDIGGIVVTFLSQGDNLRDALIALGILIAASIVPPFLAWAAATIAATWPLLAIGAAVFAVVKVLNDMGLLGPIVTAATKLVGTAFEWLSANVLPKLRDAFTWLTTNLFPVLEAALAHIAAVAIPAIGDAFSWVAANVLPLLGAAFDWITTTAIPALGVAFEWVVTNVLPALGAALDFVVTTVIPAVATAFSWVATNVLPLIGAAIGFIATTVIPALSHAFAAVVGWVQANWPTIASIIGQVGGAIRTVFDAIGTVAKTVFPLVARFVSTAFDTIKGVIDTVAPIIGNVSSVVFPAIGTAATVVLHVIDVAFKAIGGIVDTLATGFKDFGTGTQVIVDGVGKAWTALTGVMRTVWSGIEGVVRAGANVLIGIVNGVISAVDAIQVHIGRIGLDTPVGWIGVGPFDWNGLNLPHVPYLAGGTPSFAGGWAVLGERGPELAKLPGGTAVFPAGQTAAMLGGSGPITFAAGSIVLQGIGSDVSAGAARRFGQTIMDEVAGGFMEQAARRGIVPTTKP